MHEQDASAHLIQAAMLEREERRDLHWRQPWTSDSLALGSEMKTSNHTGFFSCYKGIKGAFQNLLQAFRVYTCVASSATTWVNQPKMGGTDTDVSGKAVGTQQTLLLW